jgi:hypothetical protein
MATDTDTKPRRVVTRLPAPGIENGYILLSFGERGRELGCVQVDYIVSFLYDAGDTAAEWEPKYGPIKIFWKCESDHPKATRNYFYEYVIDEPGNWAQHAVDDYELPRRAIDGDLGAIFFVLKEFSERNENPIGKTT